MIRPTSTLKLAELKNLAGIDFGSAFDRARQCNNRMPVPPTPCRECLAAFGRTLQWRTGDNAAVCAAQRLSAQWLTQQQIGIDLAAKWALFYINEKFRNRRNPSAAGRARYLVHAAALLHQHGKTGEGRSAFPSYCTPDPALISSVTR